MAGERLAMEGEGARAGGPGEVAPTGPSGDSQVQASEAQRVMISVSAVKAPMPWWSLRVP